MGAPDFPVYSPSQTLQWLACLRKWQLERHGWEATFLEWNPAQAVGSAIHAGWAALNKGQSQASADLAVLESLTRDIPGSNIEQLDRLDSEARRALAAIPTIPGEPLAIEEPIYGCIPDLVTRENGCPVVTELKTSYKWDDRAQWFEKNWAARKAEYETSWQILHEAWAAQETYGLPVLRARVVHVGVTPRVWVKVHEWGLDPAVQAAWLTDWAMPTWEAMESARLSYLADDDDINHPAPGNPHRCHTYGGCPFLKLCWSLAGDLTKARGFYTKGVGRR